MSHANATLTPAGRLRLARLVVDRRWSYARAAERFSVSVTTARRWADRYREHGAAGMGDRSSRPHRSPGQQADQRDDRAELRALAADLRDECAEQREQRANGSEVALDDVLESAALKVSQSLTLLTGIVASAVRPDVQASAWACLEVLEEAVADLRDATATLRSPYPE